MKKKPAKIKDPIREAKIRLVVNLGLFSGLLFCGSMGYYLISHTDNVPGSRTFLESLYFTLVVLTTVGMEAPLSQWERYFSIALMLVGIFLIAAAASNLVAFAIDGEINKHFGRRKLQKQINALTDHFIIVGYGRMGKTLCEQMIQTNQSFVMVELDEAKCAEAELHNILYIRGDATDEEVLISAGLKRAIGLATCLPHDPANVFVTLTAREVNQDLEIVARSEDPASESKLRRAGANRTICPAKAGARQLYEMLVKPVVVDMIAATSAERHNIDICVFQANKLPKMIGLTIAECDLKNKTGMVVTAIEREGLYQFIPTPGTIIQAADKIYLMGPDQSSDSLISHFSV